LIPYRALKLKYIRSSQRLWRSLRALDNGDRVVRHGGWRTCPGTVLLWGRSLCFSMGFYVGDWDNEPPLRLSGKRLYCSLSVLSTL
jgi:hypothetical protein